MTTTPDSRGRRGAAYVLAVVLLALFAAMAVAMASESDMNARVARNHLHGQTAQFQAESGLAYLLRVMRNISGIPRGATPQEVLDHAAGQLPGLIGTANLNGQTLQHTPGVSIVIPFIALDGQGGGFTAVVDTSGANLRLRVTGTDPVDTSAGSAHAASRNVQMQLQVSNRPAAAFSHGIMSKGKVSMTGNARVTSGDGDPASASVLSATYSDPEAVQLTGNCRIDGDLYVSNPAAHVSMTGNISIGGQSSWGGNIYDHVHIGTEEVEFPTADPSVFEPFATNIVDFSTSTNGNKTFTNIRIRANTNPTFAGNITIRGILYIETPNRVTFAGNLDMSGVIVTQDAGPGALDDNYLHFTGNSSFSGVESLPGDPQFTGLKALPGAFILAPGFSTKFTGNFGAINGTIAADEFKWTGNASGDVHGSVVCWADNPFTLVGNSNIRISRDASGTLPPGFVPALTIAPVPNSYEEPLPGGP